MRVSQAHPGFISLDRRVRPPNPLLPKSVEHANQKSDLVASTVFIERWDSAGSIPVSTTSTQT